MVYLCGLEEWWCLESADADGEEEVLLSRGTAAEATPMEAKVAVDKNGGKGAE
jgi:hypothetical protein